MASNCACYLQRGLSLRVFEWLFKRIAEEETAAVSPVLLPSHPVQVVPHFQAINYKQSSIEAEDPPPIWASSTASKNSMICAAEEGRTFMHTSLERNVFLATFLN